jgi:hypothetical protein
MVSDDVRKLLNRARSEGSGGSMPMLPPSSDPREEFKDVSYLLERSLHLSVFSQVGTYESRVLHLKRFMSLGLARLPDKEEAFVKEMQEFMANHLDSPKVEPRPSGGGEEAPQYEIQTNIRGAGSYEVYREHLEFTTRSIRESFYEEQYNVLMLWADRLVMRLVDHKVLRYKDMYQGGKIGQWAKTGRASALSRFIREEEEEGEPEDDDV